MPEQTGSSIAANSDMSQLDTVLKAEKLQQSCKLYGELILAETGAIWTGFRNMMNSQGITRFRPFVELTHDEQLAWVLHKYLGFVSEGNQLIVTETGYLGLGPPNTETGDIVEIIGGPGVPFVVRDTPIRPAHLRRAQSMTIQSRTTLQNLYPNC
jgi:hypothetical protein